MSKPTENTIKNPVLWVLGIFVGSLSIVYLSAPYYQNKTKKARLERLHIGSEFHMRLTPENEGCKFFDIDGSVINTAISYDDRALQKYAFTKECITITDSKMTIIRLED